jgi:transcriptional regulator with PAS, ATPase and Fis domain
MGLFEAADGGFLFLDEVGDVELALQGKLLKAVEERTVRRVGGTRDRRVDVRILAATNRDLERAARSDQFRRDLYFRLAVIILHLPPLRERGQDVVLLAEEFLKRFSVKYGKDVRPLGARAQELLIAYPWPGNVRELSHVVERAVLWSRDGALDFEHLARDAAAAPAPVPATPSALPPLGTDLERWEKSMIEEALRECEGNQTRAAARLGITRDTLRYRLKKHGLA